MIRRLFSIPVVFVLALSVVALASPRDYSPRDDKAVTLTGHVVDKACSAKVAKKDNPQAASAEEDKGCITRCAKSGLGIYADGKYTEFDEKGAALALAALEKSPKTKGAKFKVTGKMADGKMAVESISEVE